MAPPPSPSRQGKKRSLGRRKIEMKLIKDENARTVTFSKRRAGLFKKATELSVLCGTQIALIIFSLGGRAYSFGHPDVESIIGRFFNRSPIPSQESSHASRIRVAMLQEIKGQLDQKSEELNNQKRRGKEIEAALDKASFQTTQERLDELDLHQLEQLKQKMEKLKEEVHRLANAPPQVNADSETDTDTDIDTHVDADVPVAVAVDTNAAEPSCAGKVDLANVRNEECSSPVPPDWLKL